MLLDGALLRPSVAAPGTRFWQADNERSDTMANIFGMALLPLWIMGAPLIGALFSLAIPAPHGNTMPRARLRHDHHGHDHHDGAVAYRT